MRDLKPLISINLAFLKELAKNLCRPHCERNYPICKPSDLKIRLRALLSVGQAQEEQRQPLDGRLETKKTYHLLRFLNNQL